MLTARTTHSPTTLACEEEEEEEERQQQLSLAPTRGALAILYCSPGEVTLVWAAPFVKTGYRFNFCVFSVLVNSYMKLWKSMMGQQPLTFDMQWIKALDVTSVFHVILQWGIGHPFPTIMMVLLLEWPCVGVVKEVTPAPSWLGPHTFTCISYSTSSIPTALGGRISTDLRWVGKQPSDLILLFRIKHGFSSHDLMLIPRLEHLVLTAYLRQHFQFPYYTRCRYAVPIQS